MAKDISRLLQKGNLTPKERHFLKVANLISKEKTGKAILSDADEYALTEGWQPLNNDEVKEYNRYNQAWKTAMFAEMDAQTTYLHAKIEYQSIQMILKDFALNPIHSEVKRALAGLEKIKRVKAKEAIEIINAQRQEKLKRGVSFERAIYDLAFEILDEENRKKLLEFFEDANTETEWLDEEEKLAELFKVKDFEGIAEQVSKKIYNAYAQEYQLFHYYACISINDIAKRYAKENNLPFEEMKLADEDKELSKETGNPIPDNYQAKGRLDALDELTKTLEQHAKDKQTTVEAIIKQACLKWIGEGLFENDHTPLIIADPDLLNKWLETKAKARATLRGLIDKGTLSTGKDEDGEEIITGDSLYNCGLDYAFIKEFKDYADEYSPNLGLVKNTEGVYQDEELLISEDFISRYKIHLRTATNLLEALSIVEEKDEGGDEVVLDIEKKEIKELFLDRRNGFIKNYEILLGFGEFFKRLSKTYGMDLSYRVDLWIAECKHLAEGFNDTLLDALKIELPFSHQSKKKKHFKDKTLFIDTEKIKPNKERVEPAFKELSDLLGNAF